MIIRSLDTSEFPAYDELAQRDGTLYNHRDRTELFGIWMQPLGLLSKRWVVGEAPVPASGVPLVIINSDPSRAYEICAAWILRSYHKSLLNHVVINGLSPLGRRLYPLFFGNLVIFVQGLCHAAKWAAFRHRVFLWATANLAP